MKHLKIFENFKRLEIQEFCKKYHIIDYKINEDGIIPRSISDVKYKII